MPHPACVVLGNFIDELEALQVLAGQAAHPYYSHYLDLLSKIKLVPIQNSEKVCVPVCVCVPHLKELYLHTKHDIGQQVIASYEQPPVCES